MLEKVCCPIVKITSGPSGPTRRLTVMSSLLSVPRKPTPSSPAPRSITSKSPTVTIAEHRQRAQDKVEGVVRLSEVDDVVACAGVDRFGQAQRDDLNVEQIRPGAAVEEEFFHRKPSGGGDGGGAAARDGQAGLGKAIRGSAVLIMEHQLVKAASAVGENRSRDQIHVSRDVADEDLVASGARGNGDGSSGGGAFDVDHVALRR